MPTAKKIIYSMILVLAYLLLTPSKTRAQASVVTINPLDKAHLDSLAALTAQKIRSAKLVEKEPNVLVIDFFRNSPGTSSQLGAFLADRFSDSLASYSGGMKILDRKIIRDYLLENWTTLDDLKSSEICLAVARQLGATGAILGNLTEKKDYIELTLHLEGFGPTETEDDIFAWRERTITFPLTDELHAALYQAGPNYSRKADEIPQEPGVFRAGVDGVTSPECAYCPNPDYSDAARRVKAQGNVILSVVVTADGQVGRIYVLKGAPFGLTNQAITATKSWRLRPGRKDGNPVPVRTSLEVAFRLSN